MATALQSSGPTSYNLLGPVEFTLPAATFNLADQTATTAAQDCGTTLTWFRALVGLKTYTVGSATIGPFFELEVDTASGMTTALESVAGLYMSNTGSSTKIHTRVLIGRVAATLKRYVRIAVTFNGSSSGTFDAHIDAV